MKNLTILFSLIILIASCSRITEIPTVTTSIPVVSDSTVIVGGEVTFTDRDINTKRGVCWSKSPNPTTNDGYILDGSTGAGPFSLDIFDFVHV